MAYNSDGIHGGCVVGLSITLNAMHELTDDNPFPIIAVLPAISNGASYRLCRKIYGYLA